MNRNILVACEESQAVTIEFRKLGFEAYSCDILPPSGGHPEWHLETDVTPLLQKPWQWDMIIAFPPCTYLCNSGVRWLYTEYGRWEKMVEAANFFHTVLLSNAPYVAVENAIPHGYARSLIGRKYDQIVQPYDFGHGETKATCLWLKGLPPLVATDKVSGRIARVHRMPPSPDRACLRAKTFPGIAKAMAEQWGKLLSRDNETD